MEQPQPAIYLPFLRGSYDVNPNLKLLGTDYGNGVHDRNVFQIDTEYQRFIENKQARRDVLPIKSNLTDAVAIVAAKWIWNRLAEEHGFAQNSIIGNVRGIESLSEAMMVVQEDLAIVSFDGERDWTSFLHVASPSHWSPEEKIGKSFVAVHDPVPGFEKIVPAANGLVQAMIHKGPFVRFVWTLTDDTVLNHHPKISGPAMFENGKFWVRTERQVMVGLPEVNASLFFIRVGFVPIQNIVGDNLEALKSTLKTMSLEIRDYKGLTPGWPQIEKLLLTSNKAL